MVVKREAPSTPTASEYGSSGSPSPVVKRAKSAKTPSPNKKPSPQKTPKPKPDGVITNEMKAEMVEAALDSAYKGGLAFDVFAEKVCFSPLPASIR
jgi:hypothetical protein